jgi:hypothetical protein
VNGLSDIATALIALRVILEMPVAVGSVSGNDIVIF